MTLKKNIGKNTIGDNKKMEVDLRTYNMSTHDLSTIFRNTQSPGTLVPTLCLLAQKGDTLDIDIESHVLTHPTVGPFIQKIIQTFAVFLLFVVIPRVHPKTSYHRQSFIQFCD